MAWPNDDFQAASDILKKKNRLVVDLGSEVQDAPDRRGQLIDLAKRVVEATDLASCDICGEPVKPVCLPCLMAKVEEKLEEMIDSGRLDAALVRAITRSGR